MGLGNQFFIFWTDFSENDSVEILCNLFKHGQVF